MTQFAKETLPISLEEEMRRSYLDYAMSVIVGRALPDARDGLKPVHRRVLFAMHELNNDWNRPYKKSARIVGDVIGKYHPHGDQSVYDTIVRMAQDFSMRHMLVDGQGNFGSIDGDNAAAMRYTEARMSKLSHELMADIDKDTVDFQPNYDEKELEPTVMPTRVPAGMWKPLKVKSRTARRGPIQAGGVDVMPEVHRVLGPGGRFFYADFRDRPDVDAWRRSLAASGMAVEEDEKKKRDPESEEGPRRAAQ